MVDPISLLEQACAASTPLEITRIPPDPGIRQDLLELAAAPSLPVDPSAYRWEEPYPNFRVAVTKVDAARKLTAGLLWAKPGAKYPPHRHLGDESVLVLQGTYRDESGDYGPGEVVRRTAGSVHSVEVPPGDDCISYIVLFGGHRILE